MAKAVCINGVKSRITGLQLLFGKQVFEDRE